MKGKKSITFYHDYVNVYVTRQKGGGAKFGRLWSLSGGTFKMLVGWIRPDCVLCMSYQFLSPSRPSVADEAWYWLKCVLCSK